MDIDMTGRDSNVCVENPIDEDIILEVRDLCTEFRGGVAVARPIDGVSFRLRRGKTLALVGESGSGKSVTSLSIMRLLGPTGVIRRGNILLNSPQAGVVDIATLSERQMRSIRGRQIAMIFQDPMSSLNPLLTVGDQIMEMIRLHEPVSRSEARIRAQRMMEFVEIPSAAKRIDDYPHQMSGGMRQRVMIALALSCNPSILIADEPTTALDVTVQAQVLDLMNKLQQEVSMSILFITHNLGVVAEIADEVMVMYAGKIVEQAPVGALFDQQKHPYTKGLLACLPSSHIDPVTGEVSRLAPIEGSVPSLFALPQGCSFAPRCSLHAAMCDVAPGPALRHSGTGHYSRCLRLEEL